MSSTATTNTMPVGTISLTTQQLMEMLANARAEGRAEALKELGVASSTGGVAPAVPFASAAPPAPTVAQDAATQPPPKKKRKRKRKCITLPDGAVVRNITSAYMFYCNKHRAETKEANPELKPTELTAALGAQWSALTDEGKAPYNTLAAADKERYAAQVAQAAEAASGASMGATDTTAAAPAAAPPTAPPVLPGAAAPSPDIIEPVPLPPSLMPSPAATAVFKTGTPGASSSA